MSGRKIEPSLRKQSDSSLNTKSQQSKKQAMPMPIQKRGSRDKDSMEFSESSIMSQSKQGHFTIHKNSAINSMKGLPRMRGSVVKTEGKRSTIAASSRSDLHTLRARQSENVFA